MRAIIINDADARALLDSLELENMRAANNWPHRSKATNEAIQEAHRTFHYIVCRWLMEQGSDVVR